MNFARTAVTGTRGKLEIGKPSVNNVSLTMPKVNKIRST